MRTIGLALLATFASTLGAACAPIGDAAGTPKSTVDGGSAAVDQNCDTTNIPSQSGSITFTGSADNVPTGCWQLTGTLTVGAGVSTLAKLGDLRGVTNLVIKGSSLTSIDTPYAIAVGQQIDIENNAELTDLTNLSVPTDSTGTTCGTYIQSVTLTNNAALTGLGGLNQLRCVSGATAITNNAALTTVDLSNAIRLEAGLTISGNALLSSIQLTALDSVTTGIDIENNAVLTDLGTWSALQFIHGYLTIEQNPMLTTLAGVFTQTQAATLAIEGKLTIDNNATLTEVDAFAYLASAVTIDVSNNADLTYCEARAIGCCVLDSEWSSASGATISKDNGTTCATQSWCYAQNGTCSNNYTGYSGGNPSGQPAAGNQ